MITNLFNYKEKGVYTPILASISSRPEVKITVRSFMHCFWARGKHPRTDKDIEGRLKAFVLAPEALRQAYRIERGRLTDRGQNVAWQLWSKVRDKDIYMIVEQYPDGNFVLYSIRFGK